MNEEGVEKMMSKKIFVAAVIAYAITVLLGPRDMISQITFGAMASMLCLIPLLILARLAFFKNAPKPMHTLVCVLVCMVAVLSIFCHMLMLRITQDTREFQDTPVVTSRP
jgi:hypothetical protein